MTNAEKFITIWLDGDKEKALSMIENNDWVEITAERVEEILNILIKPDDSINKIAIESKLIIEQFQKLLGVYTTTEAFGKIAVIMREESEIEIELNKYKKLVNSIYEIVSVNCTDVGEAHAGIQQAIEELMDKCPAVTNGVHLWCVNGFDETRLCKHCGTRR